MSKKTNGQEQYAFEDYSNSDMTREEAEYHYHKQKPKPTYSAEYNPDKPKIDFVGLGYEDLGIK